jgi:hypothetical protein
VLVSVNKPNDLVTLKLTENDLVCSYSFLVFGFLLYRPMSFESVDEFWCCAVRRWEACGNIGETSTCSVEIILCREGCLNSSVKE